MLKGVKNILFDLGGVLFHIDYNRTIDAFKELGITNFKKYFTQHQQCELFDAFETGKISAELFVKTIQKLSANCANQEIIDAWNAMLVDLPKENLNFLVALSENYRLFLLSNTNEIHIQFVNAFLKSITTYLLSINFSKRHIILMKLECVNHINLLLSGC